MTETLLQIWLILKLLPFAIVGLIVLLFIVAWIGSVIEDAWIARKRRKAAQESEFDIAVRCLCCDEYTLPFQRSPKSFEICPNCLWQDDVGVLDDWNEESGANGISLIQARQNYAENGTCSPKLSQTK